MANPDVFRAVFDQALDAIVIADDDRRYVYANPSACALFELAPEELIGKRPDDLRSSDGSVAWQELGSNGEARAGFRMQHPDGSTRELEGAATANVGPGLHMCVVREVTEQRRAAEAVRESKRISSLERSTLEATLCALPVAVWIADPDGKLVMKNRAVDALWGGDAPLSETIAEYKSYVAYSPHTGARIEPHRWALARTLATGETIESEPVDIVRFDGTRGHAFTWTAPICDDAGKILGAVVAMVDATERCTAAAERERLFALLAFEKQRFGALFQTSPALIAVTRGPEHVIEIANEACKTFVNGRPLIGLPVRDAFPEIGDQSYLARLDKVFATGAPFAGHALPVQVAGGDNAAETRYLNLMYQPFVEEDGTRSGVFIQGVDVTEHTIAKLRSTAMFQAIPAATYAWQRIDTDGALDFVLTELNAAAHRLSGPVITEWIGKSATSFFATRTDILELLRRCFTTQETITTETGVTLMNGTAKRLVMTFAYVPKDIVIIHLEDVTLRHQLEEQLRQAQKMEAVGRLAGGVAHDFNNVLSVILSYTELLLEQLNESDPMRTDLEEINKAGHRAVGITRQLLAFSRKQLLQPRQLDLDHTLRSLGAMLRRLIGEDIELTLSTGSSPTKVYADPGQIEQVIMNLVINARDAMPKGGKLTIETSNVLLDETYVGNHFGVTAGAYVMLAVTDNGHGMDAETKAQIFEPFFTTKPVGKGTGLGLAMVFGIVHQSGGNIWVYSEPGLGTSFKIYLPQATRSETTDRLPLSKAPPARGHETILLVEDDPAVRRLACTILRRAGYTVLDAENGGEALMMADQYAERIDLLLTDVVMPRMSGRELVEQISRSRDALKVIYMSGYTDDAIVHHGVIESGVPFLQKPITVDKMLNTVRNVLDRVG
jgi:PAS domain S-box-containing protein